MDNIPDLVISPKSPKVLSYKILEQAPPEESPPAPEETPPQPEETPPPPEETPPAPEETPPAPEESPPAPEETPPAPEETPPAPEESPPAPEETSPAPEETPPAPEETSPAPEETPPAPEETPPAPEEATLQLEIILETKSTQIPTPETTPQLTPKIIQPSLEPTPTPTPEPAPEPIVEPTPEPVVEPVPEPVVPEPIPEPVVEPVPNPVVPEPTPEPVVEPVSNPVVPEPTPEPTPEPVVEPIPEPVVPEPAPEPAPEPIPEPTPKPVVPEPAPEVILDIVPEVNPSPKLPIILSETSPSIIFKTNEDSPNNKKQIEITNKPKNPKINIPSDNNKLKEIKVERYTNMPNNETPKTKSNNDKFGENYDLDHHDDDLNLGRSASSEESNYMHDIVEYKNEDEKTITNKKNKILKIIDESKKKIDTTLYIICSKYDLIYFRYNRISLLILIISTVTTFIEAFRLTLVNYYNNNDSSGLLISLEQISLFINIISLVLGTLLTILSSIVKFRNYRENMEKLKNSQAVLFNYKGLFNKQKELLEFFDITKALDNKIFMELERKLEEYNKEVRDVNIFENIRTRDKVKFNSIKVDHDLQLAKLASKKELGILRLTIDTNNQRKKIKSKEENFTVNSCICFPIK